jgi:hypothetical protein
MRIPDQLHEFWLFMNMCVPFYSRRTDKRPVLKLSQSGEKRVTVEWFFRGRDVLATMDLASPNADDTEKVDEAPGTPSKYALFATT